MCQGLGAEAGPGEGGSSFLSFGFMGSIPGRAVFTHRPSLFCSDRGLFVKIIIQFKMSNPSDLTRYKG